MSSYDQAFVRILNSSGPVGAGVLIAPDLILTCAHVVADALDLPENTQEKPAQTLNLDFPLVDGHPPNTATVEKWIRVGENPKIGTPDDLAVLKLNRKVSYEPLKLIILETYDSIDVRLFGFPETKDEGVSIKGQTQGQTGSGYVQINPYAHQGKVEPGFSGAAVYANKQGALGIVVIKDDYAGIPLAYMIPAKTIQKAFPQLGIYSWPLPAAEHAEVEDQFRQQICNQIRDMGLFIGRPQEAYQHVIKELKGPNAVVKACLCFYASTEDEPNSFAESLAVQLKDKTSSRLGPELLSLKQTFGLKRFESNPWDDTQKELFFRKCLDGIWDSLRIPESKPTDDESKQTKVLLQQLRTGIINHLVNEPMPIVFLALGSIKPVKAGLFNRPKPIIDKINTRFEWVAEFNIDWQKSVKDYCQQNNVNIQNMVLLFFLMVDDKIAKQAGRCFQLNKISNTEIRSWLNKVHNLLGESGQFSDSTINQVVQGFESHFDSLNSVFPLNPGFTLTYRKFCEHAEKYPPPRKKS